MKDANQIKDAASIEELQKLFASSQLLNNT